MVDERGQAYTLEGVVGAALILLALLYAIQSLIITPTTGGPTDTDVEAALQQEAEDILLIASRNESFGLSGMIRYWNQSDQTFTGAVNPRIGYGEREPPGGFGTMLEETFSSRARSYNIVLRYRGRDIANGTKELTFVERGRPSGSSVVATQTVVLYDNMTLTSPSSSNAELWQYDTNATANPRPGQSGYYPIPNVVEGPVYNIVEVRLIVW